jgi:hypothetical protein
MYTMLLDFYFRLKKKAGPCRQNGTVMRRIHLFEFEDQPWFPALIRGFMTDYLNFTATLTTAPFEAFTKKLKTAMEACGTRKIVDLCSGGGGPVPVVVQLLKEQENYPVQATLTDYYPNLVAFRRIQALHPQISFVSDSVDATQVSPEMQGFRTLFNGFHHFRPDQAKKILKDAAQSKQGIAIFELVGRSPFALFSVATILISLPLLTPFMKPFRVSRLIFTYLIPLVPLFALWDGVVSCLRVYSPEQLKEMIDSISAEGSVQGYTWETALLPFGKIPGHGTYVIGIPKV